MKKPDVAVDSPASTAGEARNQEESGLNRWRAPGPRARWWLAAAGTVMVTCVLAVVLLRVWEASWPIPFAYSGGDANAYGLVAKSATETAWPYANEYLNAPFGQELYDVPLVDALPFAMMKLIALVVNDYGAVVNLFFLMTFPLVALAAFYTFTQVGLRLSIASVLSVLFSLLPYHFIRGETHLFLSSYFTVPLGILLIFWVVGCLPDQGPPHRAENPKGIYELDWRRLIWAGILTALVGLNGLYYAFFTLLLMVILLAFRQLRGVDRQSLKRGVVVLGLVGLFALVNTAPTFVYAAAHGSNPVTERSPAESELFGLKITSMVLPREGHRVAPLSRYMEEYAEFPTFGAAPRSESGQALGLVATVGFLALLVFGLSGIRRRWISESEVRLLREAFALVVTAVLFAVVTGFAVLFAVAISPQIRSWNRVTVFIAFCGFLALGILVQAGMRRLSDSRLGTGRRPTALLVALLVVLLIGGVFDQTSPMDIPDYAGVRRSFESDAAFVQRLEERLPAEAAVFQLPYMSFPESRDVNRMANYDPLKGYLQAGELEWSYGGVKGRQGPWQVSLLDQNATQVWPAALVAAGFGAIWIDRNGYIDNGAAVEAELTEVLGKTPMVSRDRRLSAFVLDDYAERVRAAWDPSEIGRQGELTLYAPTARWVREPVPSVGVNGDTGMRRVVRESEPTELRVENPGTGSTSVSLRGRSKPVPGGASAIRIDVGDRSHVVDAGTETEFVIPLSLRPGETNITLTPVAGDSGGTAFEITGPGGGPVGNLLYNDEVNESHREFAEGVS
ncbi:MAG: hypothetical protein IT198_08990 [Acidimicrobiia bacterium]|nr:hypothetical protein [Acidimicrobiia bacterium]